MHMGKVIGRVVACEVYPGLAAVPFLWVQPVNKSRQPKGKALVCADATRMAGPGEWVYFEGGREAAMLLDPAFVPVDHAVVGIVDELNIPEGGAA
jgi:ethanolamine utilization protein EutN